MIGSTSSSDIQPRTRLHRSATDRIIAGVCGGIAEFLAVDPSLVRLAFVVGILWGGAGLLVYVALAIVLPLDQQSTRPPAFSSERTHVLAGMLLMLLGGLLLASNLGWLPWLTWSLLWPSVLILTGFALLVRDPHSSGGS